MNKINPSKINNLIDLYKSKKLYEAEILTKNMLLDFPEELILHNLLGAIYIKKKELLKAVNCFQKAIKIKPDYAEAYNNLGNAFRELKKYPDAISCFNKALKIKPNFAEAHNNMGILFKEQENLDEAISHYEKSISIKPDMPDSYNNIGNVLKDKGEFDKAISNLNKAIKIYPDFVEAHNNIGLTLQKQKKFLEAEKSYKKALKINSEFEEVKYNLGYLYLTIENFTEGWKWHEHRKAKNILSKNLKLDESKMWNGQQFNGSLIIFGEQGLGDQILFSSILSDVLRIQSDITVIIEDRLCSMFTRSFEKIKFLKHTDEVDHKKYDKYIFLGSLGKLFRKSIDSFPKNQKNFLFPKIAKSKEIKNYLNKLKNKKIGLSWQTDSVNNKKGRNIPLKFFEQILKIKECNFIDLQYGDTKLERSEIRKNLNVDIFHIDKLDYKNDIEGLMGLIDNCDLVITIPNFTTQLAAAMGVPVFVLLPFSSDWRWFVERKNSPWYPNIEIFRQKKLGEWKSIIKEIHNKILNYDDI